MSQVQSERTKATKQNFNRIKDDFDAPFFLRLQDNPSL